ncbi:DUF6279 family lipoprotein [Marinobacter caseinilyticus]|uniref:DUF6279 family lipoprotein n=1 Tax=Marinobacter caseinilyticus TaxID=2692195 RepID=UPI00140B02A7|nr:DUF6279 family lipoprotein [Marinobacter caseinilyticus]
MRRFHYCSVVVLALVFLMAGCSSTRMAYRYADWGIVWWVEDYITLTDTQRNRLNSNITEFKQQHCQAELPKYANWLTRLEQAIEQDTLSQATVRQHQADVFDALDRLTVEITPLATELLGSLSDAQVQELAQAMAANQADKEAEYLDPDPIAERRAREQRTLERAERWLGSLTDQQLETIHRWNQARGDQTRIWLDGRARWQQALLASLKARDVEGFADQVARLIQDSAAARGGAYQAMLAESRPALARLIADLLQQANPDQRQHLRGELAELKQDFYALNESC